ncbi:ArnT family glycosyltransferase [Nocardia vaccinii]|uniref:ArnT family glycosyltransferase n=1 Tax=Nocardia vaccinii TaxID=1822 RepID=UPI000A009A2B|nr:glycosyltransferase family 39 protein [Nocardia vaccinii]
MTSTLLEPVPAPTAPLPAGSRRPRRIRRLSPAALLVATAVLYLWDLGASGWANQFYAAAVQAGSSSWKAMLFGSSDAANSITVDKTPGALWVMDISARLFGFNAWSLLVPQALEGVAAVAVLYAAVRRAGGHWAGILAGAVLALTPVAALMFRYDNPDALLVLMLTVAAYCTLRAVEKGSAAWWLPLAGAFIGFGFLAKMLQAFLVLPALLVVYLLAAQRSWPRRLLQAGAAALAMVVSAGWYLALVALWPADSRPYIGGSQHNSVLELALGYNGVGRLTGDETGGLGNTNYDVGWNRLFADSMGGQIAWLIPAAMILGVAGLWVIRRASRTDRTRASLLVWLGWLVITGGVFSFANGILHPYYTVALAPAIGGAVGIGAALMWRSRNDIRSRVVLAGTLLVTAALAWTLLRRTSGWMPWLAPAIVVAAVLAAVLILVVDRLPEAVATVALLSAVITGLAAPAAYSIATVSTTHSGAMPSAGPDDTGGFPGGGHGGPGGGHWNGGATADRGANAAAGRGNSAAGQAQNAPGAGAAVGASRTGNPGGMHGGPFGSADPGANIVAALKNNVSNYTWAAATIGSDNAAGYQLAVGSPVMAIGGYNGTDPSPTLQQFETYVAQRKIHYYIDASVMGGMRGGSTSTGSDTDTRIAAWVGANFTAQTIDGTTVYDLTTTR